jgi:hypothetical protein
MCTITQSCKECKNYGKGGCYYGPKIIVKIFGPVWVPANAWCNRFDHKSR